MLKKIIAAIAFIVAAISFSSERAAAQTIIGAYTVSACGGQSLSVSKPFPLTMDLTGNLCVSSGGGGGGVITSPLGPTTAPSAAVAITDTGTPITGQTIGAGGQGLTGWLSQIYAAVNSSIPAGTNIIGNVRIDQTTPGTTNGVAIVGVNGATALAGSGAVGTGSQRVAVGVDSATVAGSAPVKGGVGTVNGASTYNTVAASQTAQALTGGGGGGAGDYLSHCVAFPTSTSPGVVTILDNSTTIFPFPGGATSVSNLVPFTIPIGAVSTSGAWKITTGANISVTCVGKFT